MFIVFYKVMQWNRNKTNTEKNLGQGVGDVMSVNHTGAP